YTPAADYSGSDSFTYRVRDAAGQLSNEASVLVTVAPVADPPQLSVSSAGGKQDTKIPLTISGGLSDKDGSETLAIDISNLPPGATLSAGTVIAVGAYRLTPAQLAGLTFTPPPGLSGSFTPKVTAIATENVGGDTAQVSADLPITITSVVANPPTLKSFRVNDGEAQRSLIRTIQVQFNQDVRIDDLPNDVIVTTKSGATIPVSPDRYSYDAKSFTLTLDVDGLINQDGEYLLQIRADAVASAANRALTLSA